MRGFFSEYTHDGYYFLIGRQGALCGNINKSKGKAYFSEHAIACMTNKENDTDWLAQRLDYYNLNRLSESSAQPGLSVNKLLRFKLAVPSKNEQEKIATFLCSIDRRISTQNKIIEDYKLLKKGMIQRIFKQELRFKDKQDNFYPDWRNIEFGELYSFKRTNSFSRDNLNYTIGNVKNIHYGDIHTEYHSHFEAGKERVPFINESMDINRFTSDCFVQEGDLVIADASEDYADIGKTIEVINVNNEKILAGLHTFLARRKETQIAIGFVGHLMQAHYVRLSIMRIAQGTKVLGISTKRLSKIKMRIPSFPEQQKITSALSVIDNKIELESDYLEKLKSQKQYLLQNLFV